MKYKLLNALLVTAMAAAFAPAAVATTWYVDGLNGSDGNNCTSATTACKTIGYAISLAAAGDSISVAPATYTENLTIGFSLNIIGSGASTTIIDGGRVGSVISIFNSGTNLTLSELTIQNGLAVDAGGILNPAGAKLTISHSIISRNGASGFRYLTPGMGGGISNAGTLIVSYSTLSGNYATGKQKLFAHGDGGAIWNSGTVTIAYSTLSGNTAAGFGGAGGAIDNGGTVMVSHSTLSGNSASLGGGINNTNILKIEDSTFSGNGAILGGGVHNGPNNPKGLAKVTISNATLSGNGGAGIYNGAGTTTIQNSIVANNFRGNCSKPGGSIKSNGYNLSSDGSCPFTNTGDLNHTDPLLGPLQDNGGPTQTQALLSGSRAIDSGNPHGCTDNLGNLLKTDQRGQPRHDPEDTRGCDIGAYESQSD